MTWWKRLLVMVLAAVLLISAVWWGSGRIIPAMRRLSVSQEVRLPVLMYHGVHSNPKKAGDYVITPQALEEDLLYLQRQGCTTVVMSDLIAYVQQGAPLPEKPVMITFDDGYYNNYLNAYPLLQKYQMKAVISIIVGETDKYSELDENKENYSHITWDMINEMMESGLIEIQNHTYNLHKTGNPRRGAAQRKDETTEQYFAAVGADLQKAQDRIEEMIPLPIRLAPTAATARNCWSSWALPLPSVWRASPAALPGIPPVSSASRAIPAPAKKPPRSCSAISGIEQRARGCAALPLYRTFPSGTRVPARISTP